MTVTGHLHSTVLDAADIDALASFYLALTGWELVSKDDDWITIRTGDGRSLSLQLAPDHVPPQWPSQEHPQQFHLDLLIDDIEAAASKAVELGAERLGQGATWITLADPAGHTFDLCQKDGVGPVMGLYAVTLDAADSGILAHFYADLLGAEVSYEGPEGALVSGDGVSVMIQKIDDYQAPNWPNPAAPQQAHFDVRVDDIDAGHARALELGATLLDDRPATFRVFADPAGHPFCLVF